MVSSLPLLSRESSVFVKESPDRKKDLTKTCIRIYRRLKSYVNIQCKFFFVFFSMWVFFYVHSRFTGQQGKREAIYLTPLYHFHPLHRHLDISRAITAESSPLHIASSRTRTGNLWFPSAIR